MPRYTSRTGFRLLGTSVRAIYALAQDMFRGNGYGSAELHQIQRLETDEFTNLGPGAQN